MTVEELLQHRFYSGYYPLEGIAGDYLNRIPDEKPALKQSVEERGITHPLVVTLNADNQLVILDGALRYEYVKALQRQEENYDPVPIQFLGTYLEPGFHLMGVRNDNLHRIMGMLRGLVERAHALEEDLTPDEARKHILDYIADVRKLKLSTPEELLRLWEDMAFKQAYKALPARFRRLAISFPEFLYANLRLLKIPYSLMETVVHYRGGTGHLFYLHKAHSLGLDYQPDGKLPNPKELANQLGLLVDGNSPEEVKLVIDKYRKVLRMLSKYGPGLMQRGLLSEIEETLNDLEAMLKTLQT